MEVQDSWVSLPSRRCFSVSDSGWQGRLLIYRHKVCFFFTNYKNGLVSF